MKKLIVCGLLLLPACHDHRPPAPTPQQNQQLGEAENMLNAMAKNEEGPEAIASGPSNVAE